MSLSPQLQEPEILGYYEAIIVIQITFNATLKSSDILSQYKSMNVLLYLAPRPKVRGFKLSLIHGFFRT